MLTIKIIYIMAATLAISACVPQLRQLIRSKNSSGLSVVTWSIWTFTQMVTLLYVLSIGDVLMAIVSIMWVSFYATMTVLILRYRRRTILAAVQIEPTVIAAQLRE